MCGAQVMRRIGGLYEHFRESMCWFQGYQLSRRLVVIAVLFPLAAATALDALPVALWFVMLVFLAVQLVAWPYKHTVNNVMEVAWGRFLQACAASGMNGHGD